MEIFKVIYRFFNLNANGSVVNETRVLGKDNAIVFADMVAGSVNFLHLDVIDEITGEVIYEKG